MPERFWVFSYVVAIQTLKNGHSPTLDISNTTETGLRLVSD